jgi:hypothetical protein
MLHQFTIIFWQAAGLSALVVSQVPFPAMSGRELPPVAPAGQPSKSPASTSCRSNPCLSVSPSFPTSLFCYSLFLILFFSSLKLHHWILDIGYFLQITDFGKVRVPAAPTSLFCYSLFLILSFSSLKLHHWLSDIGNFLQITDFGKIRVPAAPTSLFCYSLFLISFSSLKLHHWLLDIGYYLQITDFGKIRVPAAPTSLFCYSLFFPFLH